MCSKCERSAEHKTAYILGRKRLVAAVRGTENANRLSGKPPALETIQASAKSATDRASKDNLLAEEVAILATDARKRIAANADGQYLSISLDNPLNVSYAPKGVEKYDHAKRRATKLGRWLGSQAWAQQYRECAREAWTNAVLSRLTPLGDYATLVQGQDIIEAYREEFGHGSCMTGDDAHLVAMYAQNRNRVSLLKWDDGDQRARALLWTLPDSVRLLDRVYPNSGAHIAKIERWARGEGIIVRDHHGMPRCRKATFGGAHYTVTLAWDSDAPVPYLDSFHTGGFDGRGLLHLRTDGKGDITFCSTDGEHDGMETHSRYRCESCGSRLDEDDLRTDDHGNCYCEQCYCETYTGCNYCGREMSADDPDVVCDGEVYCQRCADRRLSHCERCTGYSTDSLTTVHLDNGEEEEWCESCCDHAYTCDGCAEMWETVDDDCRCAECARPDASPADDDTIPIPLDYAPLDWHVGIVPQAGTTESRLGYVSADGLWAIRLETEKTTPTLLHSPSGLVAGAMRLDRAVECAVALAALPCDWQSTTPAPPHEGRDIIRHYQRD